MWRTWHIAVILGFFVAFTKRVKTIHPSIRPSILCTCFSLHSGSRAFCWSLSLAVIGQRRKSKMQTINGWNRIELRQYNVFHNFHGFINSLNTQHLWVSLGTWAESSPVGNLWHLSLWSVVQEYLGLKGELALKLHPPPLPHHWGLGHRSPAQEG